MVAAELIRLDRRPAAGRFCVSVNGLAQTTEAGKLDRLLSHCGGPLADLVLFKEATGSGHLARQWAKAQFFCNADAERCCQECDGCIIDNRRIEVARLPPLKLSDGDFTSTRDFELSAPKAISVMNHLCGFNGWSSEVLELRPAEESTVSGRTSVQLRSDATATGSDGVHACGHIAHVARVRVLVHADGVEAIGEGGSTSEERWSGGEVLGRPSTITQGERGSRSKKSAVTNALRDALIRLAIVRFHDGRVTVRAVEADTTTSTRCAAGTTATSAPVPTATKRGFSSTHAAGESVPWRPAPHQNDAAVWTLPPHVAEGSRCPALIVD